MSQVIILHLLHHQSWLDLLSTYVAFGHISYQSCPKVKVEGQPRRKVTKDLERIGSTALGNRSLSDFTANVNSRITDKLRYLSVVSKQTHLFLDIFESCYNHRQMSVKIKIKSHIQQKN